MSQTTFNNGDSLAVVRAAINANATDAETRLALMENSIIVKSLSDLPTPISNEIILTNNNYIWIGSIDLAGNTLVVDSVNVRIYGQGWDFSTIFENAVDAIHIKSGSLFLEDITLSDGGAKVANGIQVDATGVLGLESTVINGFDIGIKLIQADTLFVNFAQLIGQNTSVQFNGASSLLASFFLCNFLNYINYGIEFVTGSTLEELLLSSVRFNSSSVPSYALSGDADSANLNIRGSVSNCSFNGSGNALENITEKDIKWDFSQCFGVFNTTDYGFLEYSNPGVAATTVVSGSWTVISAIGASWALLTESARFVEDTDGILKFKGQNKDLGECEFEISAKTGTGVVNNYELGISIDGATPAANSIVPVPISSAGRIAAWSFPSNLDVIDKTWELQIRGVGTAQAVIFLGAHVRLKRT